MGSPWYMAPEQMLEPQSVDARADVWGLGATLFHLVAGFPPFDGESIPEVCAKVLNRPAPRLSEFVEVDPELERIVQRCLEKSPGDRFQTMEGLLEALSPLATADHSGLLAPASSERPSPPQRAVEPEAPTQLDSVSPIHLSRRDIPGLRYRWIPAAVVLAAVVGALGAVGADRAQLLDFSEWRALTDGVITPAPLHPHAPAVVDEVPGFTDGVLAVMPRGVVGRRAAEGRNGPELLAEREIELDEDRPGPDSVAEARERQRRYQEYLRAEGLRPIGEVLREIKTPDAWRAQSPPDR